MDPVYKVPAERAKAILIALCSEESSLILQRVTTMISQMDKLDSRMPPGKKRKVESAMLVCVQCQEPFYEDRNSDQACRYHDGELEPDYDDDAWPDHDEDCHGPIDTDENRMEFPEGFIWSCCDKQGHRSGCTRGRHTNIGSHRGRYGTKPGVTLKPSASDTEEESPDDGGNSEGSEAEK